MKVAFATALAVLAFSTSPARADFDLKFVCKTGKVPSRFILIPKEVTIEIDLDSNRARIRDEIIAETNVGWHYVDGVRVRGQIISIAYPLRPSRNRVQKNQDTYYRYYSYQYRIDTTSQAFSLFVSSEVGANKSQRGKGKCVTVD